MKTSFFYLLLISYLFLSSCSTFHKTDAPINAFPSNDFSTIQDFSNRPGTTSVPQWQNFESGVDILAARIAKPRLQIWAVRVDLAEPSLAIVINGKEAADKGSIPSIFVSSFVRDYTCIAGINASPFDTVSGKEGERRGIIGITVADGVVVAQPAARYDALVFYKDGTAAIVNQGSLSDLSDIENAVGGFYAVLKNGALTERALSTTGAKRHPRSAVGIADNYLYLLVIDGRTRESAGATEAETALILFALGATDGLNLDGGGSTALALTQADGTVFVANTPIHNNIKGKERGVATCIGIKRK
ncbi:phosphodiester glycosidase family protein [Breznakiellaceae bacterium SP9]